MLLTGIGMMEYRLVVLTVKRSIICTYHEVWIGTISIREVVWPTNGHKSTELKVLTVVVDVLS